MSNEGEFDATLSLDEVFVSEYMRQNSPYALNGTLFAYMFSVGNKPDLPVF